MKKYWIYKPFFDIVFFLSPPFLVLGFIFLFQDKIEILEEKYSFFIWLILIVFIDVAHVYATLYKTYFNPSERDYYKGYLIKVPIVCFVIGLVLFSFGYKVFWSVMAYIAVFHFIRQQYGFLRLYVKNEKNTNKRLNNLVIYNATIYPMLYWFFSPKRDFNWFVENEFLGFPNSDITSVLSYIYYAIFIFFYVYETYQFVKFKTFNLPKNILIMGTSISWYFGIVFFNNDLIFTLLNVISHGIPYMALVYVNQKNEEHLKLLPKLNFIKGMVSFCAIIIFLGFFEEFLWEILVWNEYFNVVNEDKLLDKWQFLIVPLLMVPQFTHYILDGIIWKRKNHL